MTAAVGPADSARALLEATRRAFDAVAAEYDRSNDANPILRGMRERAVETVLSYAPPGARVLDLGCGPGADTETLARGHREVTAVDWSPRMADEARRRVRAAGLETRAEVLTLGVQELDGLRRGSFDAVYSNFGSLNCVPSLPDAARLIGDQLRPGGVLVASVIGRICPWEIALYASRRDWARCRVRLARGPVAVPLQAGTVWTRYYTPRQFQRAFTSAGFSRVSLRALGLFVPPPYMQAFAERHPALLARLERLDDRLGSSRGLRAMGDHFLIVLRKA